MKTRVVVYLAVLLVVVLTVPANLQGQGTEPGSNGAEPNAPTENYTNLMNRLYSHTFASNSALYIVDPATGATTLMGYTGVSQITDIAFSARNFLYGITFSSLYHLDPYTAEGTYIGSTGFSNLNALVTSPEGIIYAANTSYGQFIRIDENTGEGTYIGNFGSGLSSSGDMIYTDDGTLYATLNRSGYTNAWLATIDPGTGTATLIGDIGFKDVWGLSIRDGIMYGVTPSGQLLQIDPASGAGALIGTDVGIAHGGLTTTPDVPLLDLPIDYDDDDDFVASLAGNIGLGDGRVNSWFDHNTPAPWGATNQQLLRWTGYPEIPNPDGNCYIPNNNCYDNHEGTDFSQDQATENIYAAAPGTVTDIFETCEEGDSNEARWCNGGYGNEVWIDHGDGYATRYTHLDDVLVDEGDELYQTNFRDNPIGTMGSTGNSTGTHLHFGVYYDPNEGWARGSVLDPYGWWDNDRDDPWTNTAQQQSKPLWKKPFSAQAVVDNAAYSLVSASNQAEAYFPAGTFATPTVVQILDAPPSAPNPDDLLSAGTSFRLTASPATAQTQSRAAPSSPTDGFGQPVTLQATYGSSASERLNTATLSMYRWDEASQSWLSLPSTVDTNLRVVTAQTIDPGEFDLKGALTCEGDPNELNDSFYHATRLENGVLAGAFDVDDDADWYRIRAYAGGDYTVEILDLAAGVDPYAELYDATGTNLITSDDNGGPGDGFYLSWTASADTTYFIRVAASSASSIGCDATYEMKTTATLYMLLPMLDGK